MADKTEVVVFNHGFEGINLEGREPVSCKP
jgi:hypothetical protein